MEGLEAEFAAEIAEQKRDMQEARSYKGTKAELKPSRREISATYRKSRSSSGAEKVGPVRTCLIAYAYPPSTAPLQSLKPIKLSDLRLETHHHGRVLIVKTFTDAKRLVATLAGIEDETGGVDSIGLYHLDPSAKPEETLPKNTVLAVKEPYYKAAASGGYIVRVDHPSDIVRLCDNQQVVPFEIRPRLVELDVSAEDRKLDGDQAYKAKKYLDALELYTQGIAECKKDSAKLKSDLLRSRSVAHIQLHRYELAAADAFASVVSGSDLEDATKRANAKSYYHAGCALYCQEKYQKALERFRQSLEMAPDNSDCLEQIERTESRLSEQKRGEYDFSGIDITKSKDKRLDHASFLGRVAVRRVLRKGRGLVASTNIKAGDLVLCEKAFLISFLSDNEAELYAMLNLNTDSGVMGAQATLLFNLTQKLLHNQEAAAKFFDLYDGGYTPKTKASKIDGVTVVDTFRVAAILEHNAFSNPITPDTDTLSSRAIQADPGAGSGIWMTGSLLNHACDGNAAHTILGDLLIVRATRAIAKGTEITIPYCKTESIHTETRKTLQKRWKFKCGCALCTVEVRTSGPQLTKRKQLVAEVEKFLRTNQLLDRSRPSSVAVNKAQSIYDQLEATYDKTLFKDSPRVGLIDLSLWLLAAQPTTGAAAAETIDKAIEVLRNCGYKIEPKGKDVKVDASRCYSHAAAVDAAVRAARASSSKETGRQFEQFAKKEFLTQNGLMKGYDERYGG